MNYLRVGVALLLTCSGCGTLEYRLLSTEGRNPAFEMPWLFEYWEFRAGTMVVQVAVQRQKDLSVLLWVRPKPTPGVDTPSPPHINVKANLLDMTVQQPARTYRPHLVERWTRIPKPLLDEWNVQPIPDGEISSVGRYDFMKVSFDKELLALDAFNIVLPPIVIDGTAYSFPPVDYLKVRIRQSFFGCEDNAARRVLQPHPSKGDPIPCVEFY